MNHFASEALHCFILINESSSNTILKADHQIESQLAAIIEQKLVAKQSNARVNMIVANI